RTKTKGHLPNYLRAPEAHRFEHRIAKCSRLDLLKIVHDEVLHPTTFAFRNLAIRALPTIVPNVRIRIPVDHLVRRFDTALKSLQIVDVKSVEIGESKSVTVKVEQ